MAKRRITWRGMILVHGFAPKRYTLKETSEWLGRGARPPDTEEECKFIFGKDCDPVPVVVKVMTRYKRCRKQS